MPSEPHQRRVYRNFGAPPAIEWHLQCDWAELLFEDEELPQSRGPRDPVAPAQPSASVRNKKRERQTAQGLPLQSWETLLQHLATRGRQSCLFAGAPPEVTFDQDTEPTPLQARALELIQRYPVPGSTLAT